MQHPTESTTTRNTASQAALTAFALERIAAHLFATLSKLPETERAIIEEAAAEIYAHSDALLITSTQPDIDRLTNGNARVIG